MKEVKIFTVFLFFLLSLFYNVLCSEVSKPTGLRIQAKNIVLRINRVSQHGVTWYFDKDYQIGTFANGDYWVVGPVLIDSITPHYDGQRNGWEVNPVVIGGQGFTSDLAEFDSSLIPKLPYLAHPVTSIVKTIRSDVVRGNNCRFCLKVAAVLTVVSEPPPPNSFRPPYVGTEKPFYSADTLKLSLLPRHDPPTTVIPLDAYPEIKKLQLDHKIGNLGREIHPQDAFSDSYGAWIGMRNADIALRLMLNDPDKDKLSTLVAYIQYGIDLAYMIPLGQTWGAGGGHRPGQKLPITFAAVMLGDNKIKKILFENDTIFHEKQVLITSKKTGRVLYGENVTFIDQAKREMDYWKNMHTYATTGSTSGNRSISDPYGYIDGGPAPGTYYQVCCTAQPWKGSVMAVKLMPALYDVWNDTSIIHYIDRWVKTGVWAQPDPCAPVDSNWANYGKTFGPDGKGGCIQDNDSSDGIGRWPKLHATMADEGSYSSKFQKALWAKHCN